MRKGLLRTISFPDLARLLRVVPPCALAVSCATPSQPLQTITVTGLDYAFQAPDSVSAGSAIVTFTNRGAVRHELYFVRLRLGRTLADLVRVTTGPERLALTDDSGAILVAEPGQSAPSRLLVDLTAGRSYALLCFLRDTTGAPQHVSLGMARAVYAK
jgi:hypothetical protein